MHLSNFKKYRRLVKLMCVVELKKNCAKAILHSKYKCFKSINFYRSISKTLLNKKSSISFFRRSCLITGNCRSVSRKFKMVRHFCKHYASYGLISGLRKSSF
jgi:ribosomal protein S14